MNEKNTIKKAYDPIKPSTELLKSTSMQMKEALHKQNNHYKKASPIFRNYPRQIAALVCLFVIIIGGMHLYNNVLTDNQEPTRIEQPDRVNPDRDHEQPNAKEPSQKIDQPDEAHSKKPMGKVKINVEGEIQEIAKDGLAFRIEDTWFIVTEDTTYSNDPTSYKVGDYVSGYTSYTKIEDYIVVDAIYN